MRYKWVLSADALTAIQDLNPWRVMILKLSFLENSEHVTFRISDFDPRYEPVFQMCFYQADGDAYIKSFSANTPHLDQIMRHYSKNAESMFNQLGYFSPIPWQDALLFFLQRVKGADIHWWLVGSCAACVRGIPLNPHDVDIMLDHADIPMINQLFADVIIEPIVDTGGWLTRDFGVLFSHARIDIASDPVAALDDPEPVDCGPYAKAHLEEVVWQGYKIKVPPVALQIVVNRKRGRMDRVKLLEEYTNTSVL